MSDDALHIEVGSIVSGRTQRGMVELKVGAETAHMDLDKAREVLGMLSGAIEAAISDELLVRFLTERINLSLEAATLALRDFRVMRQGSADSVHPQ